jgi:hypothetical protein
LFALLSTNDQSSSSSSATASAGSGAASVALNSGSAAFFLSQLVTVLRETPKVRERPRKELRS